MAGGIFKGLGQGIIRAGDTWREMTLQDQQLQRQAAQDAIQKLLLGAQISNFTADNARADRAEARQVLSDRRDSMKDRLTNLPVDVMNITDQPDVVKEVGELFPEFLEKSQLAAKTLPQEVTGVAQQNLQGPEQSFMKRFVTPGERNARMANERSVAALMAQMERDAANRASREGIAADRNDIMRDRIAALEAQRGQLTANGESSVVNQLSRQWTAAVKPVVEIDRQVKLMNTGLEAARRGDMAQGAQAILVTFQKILDPPSVVRESEYMRSAAGLALLDRIKGAYEQLRVGGAGIPVQELEKFANLARAAAKAQSTGYIDAEKSRLGRVAAHYNIPPDLVFNNYDFEAALSEQPQAPTGAAPAAPAAAPAAGGVTIVRDKNGKLVRQQ